MDSRLLLQWLSRGSYCSDKSRRYHRQLQVNGRQPRNYYSSNADGIVYHNITSEQAIRPECYKFSRLVLRLLWF